MMNKHRTTLSRIAKSPRVKKITNKMQKPQTVKDEAFGSYAVQHLVV